MTQQIFEHAARMRTDKWIGLKMAKNRVMVIGHYIGLGDQTSCGGRVLEGGTGVHAYGILHSREGDRVTCAKDGNTYRIVDGVPYMTSKGKRLAGTLHSYSTCPCRARMISSMRTARYGAWEDELPKNYATRLNHPLCNHPDRMEELANYIADEMNRNITHPSVLEMKALNSYDPALEFKEYMALPFYLRLGAQPDFHTLALAKRARALALWTERVGQNRPWDHKPIILAKFGGDRWHKHGNYDYYYDIWSNLHYGYVGLASGLSEGLLFDGAGAEQVVSDSLRKLQDRKKHPGPSKSEGVEGLRAWDDAPDRESIKIGADLYSQYPKGGVPSSAIMTRVLAVAPARWKQGIRHHECK